MKLVVITGPDEGRIFSLSEGQTFLVGRGKESDTELRDPQVSREHCSIRVEQLQALLSDCHSAAGTFVNGKSVTNQGLHHGDLIRIGETEFRFDLDATPNALTLPPSGDHAEERPAVDDKALDHVIGETFHLYRIEKELAKGTSGIVFLANRTDTDQQLALKILWPSISQNEEGMQRFVRAMKTMQPIRHPNIVQIYNAGKSGGYSWTAMEYVEGESLRRVIERIGTAGMLDWRTALRVAVHIARALEIAYEHQIVHRNIAPQNILLSEADQVAKLGDLMLAKALEGTLAVQITRPRQLIGDLAYMSPERTYGSEGDDCRSDIYGLGATLYALLTGRPPFEEKSVSELTRKIREEEPAKPKEFQLAVDDMFEDTVLQMLAKRPEDRYATPSALLKDLERIANYQGLKL